MNDVQLLLALGVHFFPLCDVAGDLRSINAAVRRTRSDYVICVGNLGFYDSKSKPSKAEVAARKDAGQKRNRADKMEGERD